MIARASRTAFTAAPGRRAARQILQGPRL